jgi:hypothetical protein
MVSVRRRKLQDAMITTQPDDATLDPRTIYQKLVARSSTLFRSDVEFIERPRQIVFGVIFLIFLVGVSGFAGTVRDDIVTASRCCLLSLLVALVIYAMLQSKDGLMVCLLITQNNMVSRFGRIQ